MVAKISQGTSLNRMLSYNERKVVEGVAKCIGAGNYPLDPERMNFAVKLDLMQRQSDLNQRAGLKAMHISLNFPPSENSLDREKLIAIADAYMEGIGFGAQPYLVYQHLDAGHPHIHIVTTTVQADGSHINTYMIGKRKSEPTRKLLEEKFGLIKAEEQEKQQQTPLKPVSAEVVDYGKKETKKAIQNVLTNVLPKYRYASLAELNAVLGIYNIRADRGDEGSRVFKNGGLLYRILDAEGKPVGVPIKASSIYSNPTWQNLQNNFNKNSDKPASGKSRLRYTIDKIFSTHGVTLSGFKHMLSKQGIDVVFRTNDRGLVYGITYVDHHTRCVLNGSELGKNYSAKAVQHRCVLGRLECNGVDIEKLRKKSRSIDIAAGRTERNFADTQPDRISVSSPFFSELLECLFRVEYNCEYIPYELRQQYQRSKRKRRTKRI